MKQLFNKIRAFFRMNGEEKVMEVEAAEIKAGIVFLHSEEDPDHTFCVKVDTVSLNLNEHGEIREEDIWIIDNMKNREKDLKASADTHPEAKTEKKISDPQHKTVISEEKKPAAGPAKDRMRSQTAGKSKEPELHENGVSD